MDRSQGQRVRRMAWIASLLAAAALGGCGGGGSSEPSAGEQRAALDGWEEKADVACRKSNQAIAKRGWPANLLDLDRLTVRAVNDVREASTTIQRMPPPKGSEKRVAPFVESLKGLDPVMEQLSSTTEKLKPAQLNELTPKLQSGLIDVEKASKALGLRHCAANDEHVWVPDALRAPAFAQQLADINRKIRRRAKAVTTPARTPDQIGRNFENLSEVLSNADRALIKLKPPNWAATEAADYLTAIRGLGSALDAASTELAEPTLTPAEAKAADRKLFRAIRVEGKRFKALIKEIGALPVVPGGGGGEEEAPGGEETQPA